MERNARYAHTALERIGCHLMLKNWSDTAHFEISAENDKGPVIDYYENYWLPESINKILDRHGLFAEWINPGVIGVYDA